MNKEKKTDILQRISSVLNALNYVTVSGKNNLANLSGSITILEEVYQLISQDEFEVKQVDK